MNRATNLAYVPARNQYVQVLQRVLPGAHGQDLEHRCSILYLRDHAQEMLNRCGDDAYPILAAIAGLATKYAYADMPTDRLKQLLEHLQRLMASASSIEAFNYAMHVFSGEVAANG